ncbi:hypothetical protein ACFQ51_52735 [Streptomyces kaempferi]
MHDHPAKPCPGPCNNAWRRAEAALAETGTEHHLTPAWGQPVQCGSCVERGRHQLTELPELLAAVHLEALYGTPAKITGTIGRAGAPVWPGQASRLLLDRIVGELTELHADILIQRGIWKAEQERPEAVTEGRLIGDTVGILLAHWDWAMQNHPAAAEPHDRDNANPGGQVAAGIGPRRSSPVATTRASKSPRRVRAATSRACRTATASRTSRVATRNAKCC